MNTLTTRFAALALAAVATLGVVSGMNGIAGTQYACAERLAMAQPAGATQLALQRVVVVGHRAA